MTTALCMPVTCGCSCCHTHGSTWRYWLFFRFTLSLSPDICVCHVQENGVQNDAEAECSGLEVTSAFTANVWEVHHLKLMARILAFSAAHLSQVFATGQGSGSR